MTSTPGAASHPVADALVGFDFAKLVASAAKLRPDRPALCDSALPSGSSTGLGLTFAQLERAVLHSAALWRDLGVPQDARVLIVAGARVAPVVAMLGALHVGLDVVLASAHLMASELVDIAEATGAVALCGEATNGGIDIADALFSAAALSTQVRYVAMLADTPIDGAATIDIKTLRDQPLEKPIPMVARKGAIITVASDGQVISHSQHALMAATVDFIAEARIGMRQPVISTLSIASFAGLVAGPLAGFMSGAQAFLHGPFDSEGFRQLLSFARQANVVIPGAAAQAIIDAGLVAGPEIGALIPLTRQDEQQHAEEANGPSLQLPRDGRLSIIDIFAFGESALATKRRAGDASALAPLATGRPTLKPLSASTVEARRAGAI